jgi:predicted ATP-grasp superfamily ATP-dependent carboligase
MKPKILILGAAGNAGILLTRCLKDDFDVYGSDYGKYKQLMECPEYKKQVVDMIIATPDSLVATGSFSPNISTIYLCQDKAKCAAVLGDLAPVVYWVRGTQGAGGKGAQMAQEYLPGRNFSVELLYYNGILHGQFAKERLSYTTKGEDEPMDKRGTSKVSTCIKDDNLQRLAIKAVMKVDSCPNGVYSLDFKENEQGEPKITEINAGRFLTASYIYFQDYNLPKRMVELALNLPLTPLGKYPEGISIIRMLDKLPWKGKL